MGFLSAVLVDTESPRFIYPNLGEERVDWAYSRVMVYH